MLQRRVTRRDRLRAWFIHRTQRKFVVKAYFVPPTVTRDVCIDDNVFNKTFRTWWMAEMARRDGEENWGKVLLYLGRGKDVTYVIETVAHRACGGGGRCADPMLRARGPA